MTKLEEILRTHFEPEDDPSCHREHFDTDVERAAKEIEALATHRAVELAERVIGEPEPYHSEGLSEVKRMAAVENSCRNALRAEQRAALAQLKGLEGK